MPSGDYHVGVTKDIKNYLDTKNKAEGYFSHPRNRGKCELLKVYRGDFRQKIRCFGVKKFLEVLESEDSFRQFVTELVC